MASNLFERNLSSSNKDIKIQRAKIFGEDAMNSQMVLIMSLKDAKRELKRKIMNLEDLSPDTAMSLNPVRGEFNPKTWVTNLHTSLLEMKEVDEELEVAINTYNKYFSTSAEDKIKIDVESTDDETTEV